MAVGGEDGEATITGHGQTVCVTGAGGYIGSWIVKLLLEKGYAVRGHRQEPRTRTLRGLAGAAERLTLCKADLLDGDALRDAIAGCHGVFHTASPVTDDPNWYCYGKTVAERAAWEAAAELGVDLVVVNPVLVQGPALQPAVNASLTHVLKYLNGSTKTYANAVQAYVHVRDTAAAHLRVFEAPSAAGRYLCADGAVLHREDVVTILRKFFPQYPIPKRCSDEVNPRKQPYKISNQRLRDLGVEFTPAAECLYDTVVSFQDKGILPAAPAAPPVPAQL
ncbi:hypothetical protein ACQ4PT_008966 [Festuca glaucescens]